ncbi:MAG: T9SS type A sorting domain-containing protein [Crocinitomicaceae bacterium]|nr:T9SS type A sorting domain-containing protein [Crocinitomicaceae bacterium]
MRRLLLLLMLPLLFSNYVESQVFISQDFNSTTIPPGWTEVGFFSTDVNPCDTRSVRRNFWSSGITGQLTSPTAIADGADIDVSFDYKIIDFSFPNPATTGNFGQMILQYTVDGGATYINYDTINESNHVPSTSCVTFTSTIDGADVPAGSVFGWRLSGTWFSGDYFFYVDNFLAAEESTCPFVTNFSSNLLSSSEVQLSWTAGGTETEWDIEYGPAGFTLGNGVVENTTNNPTNISGLIPHTSYDFYIRAVCGPGDLSLAVGPINVFTGHCLPIYTNTSDYLSLFQTTTAQQNVTYVNSSFPTNGLDNLVHSDTVSHFAGGSFDFTTNFEGGQNTIAIWVDWNNDLVFDPSEQIFVGTAPSSFPLNALNGTASIPAGVAQGDYIMRVRAIWSSVTPDPCTTFSWGSAIDLVLNVGNPPACPPPLDFDLVSTQFTSAIVEWDTLVTTSSFALEWGAPGFTPGTGTEIGASSTTATIDTITGLDPETNYDIYVIADCGADSSSWVGPLSIFTGYCVPSTSGTFSFITLFETSDATQNVVYTATAHPGSPGYLNLSASDTIKVEENETFNITAAFSSSQTTLIWVDWNQDLVFDPSEQVFVDQSPINVPINGVIQVPSTVTPGVYRLRVRTVLGTATSTLNTDPCQSLTSSNMILDYALEILPAPSCPRPSDLMVSNILPSSADVAWTAGGNETEWELQYGPAGFTPGTGTSVVTTNNPYALTGLDVDTEYDIYVRGICAVGDTSTWRGPENFMTPCNVFSAPFFEDFDDASVWISGTGFNNVGSEISSCWDRTTDPFQWGTRVGATSSTATGPSTDASGSGKYVFTSSNTGTNGQEARLWTPLIDLSSINDPRFQFSYHMFGSFVDSLNLFISNDNGATWDSLLTIVGMQQFNKTDAWKDTVLDLSNWANDTIIIEFYNIRRGINDNIAVDELKILPCVPTPGVDGEEDVCRLDVTVDLNTIITPAYNYGKWSFPSNETLINGSIMNVATLPSGTYEVFYITEGLCANDTTVATLNIFPPSSAGQNGTITVCRNEPINLFAGLNGNVDMGGTWYDPQDNPLPNSQPIASNIGGSFNFDYIVSNGVCPADTQFVEVIVLQSCDYLSIGEEKMGNISVYPNPATSHLVIANDANFESMTIEMLDINGRVVLVDNNSLMNNNQAEITIDHLTPGVYTLRLHNQEGQRTFKIVKQ